MALSFHPTYKHHQTPPILLKLASNRSRGWHVEPSRNACVGRETEVPWFFISSGDGVSEAAGAGALCGEGLEVPNETTSVVGRRALIPSRRAIAGGQAAWGLDMGEELSIAYRLTIDVHRFWLYNSVF